MNNVTEWLANLPPQTVIIVVVVLLGLRFALLKLPVPAARSAAEVVESLAIAMGLVFLVIRPFFVQSFYIPSPSMEPTLMGHENSYERVHDHILVNKAVYLVRDPKPGDIVVFRAPYEALKDTNRFGIVEKQTDYIKRCIAVEGDEIYIEPGYVLIDSEMYPRSVIQSRIADILSYENRLNVTRKEDVRVKLVPDGAYVNGRKISREKLAEYVVGKRAASVEIHPGYVVRNGVRLKEPYTAEDPDEPYPNLEDLERRYALQKAVAAKKLELIVDEGHPRVKLGKDQFLMIGDNRNQSHDSRVWGPVDRNMVVGRSMFVFWPFDRMHWTR